MYDSSAGLMSNHCASFVDADLIVTIGENFLPSFDPSKDTRFALKPSFTTVRIPTLSTRLRAGNAITVDCGRSASGVIQNVPGSPSIALSAEAPRNASPVRETVVAPCALSQWR